MNELQNYNHSMFGDLPVLIVSDIEWFGATEAAAALSFSDPHKAIKNHVEEDGWTVHPVIDSLGRKQQKKFVNESGLYELIFGASKQGNNQEIKNKARTFKRWVTSEVLPSIRKNGAYLTPDTLELAIANPDFTIGLLTNLKDEQEKRRLAEQQAWQANLILEQQRPKVVYAEAVEVSTNSILVKDLAAMLNQKGIDIGQNRLFEWFRENDYLCKKEGSMFNKPTQKSMNLGLFELKQGVRTGSNGELKTTYTPKVTGKGQVYFINKLLKHNLHPEAN